MVDVKSFHFSTLRAAAWEKACACIKESTAASSVLVTWKQSQATGGGARAAAASEDLQVWSGSGNVLRDPS